MPSGSLSARLNAGSLYPNARSKVSSAVGSPSARRQAFSTIMTSLAGAGGSMVMVTPERSEGSSSPLPAKPLPNHRPQRRASNPSATQTPANPPRTTSRAAKSRPSTKPKGSLPPSFPSSQSPYATGRARYRYRSPWRRRRGRRQSEPRRAVWRARAMPRSKPARRALTGRTAPAPCPLQKESYR